MDWYWWVLIVVTAVAVGWIKMKVLGKWMEKRKAAVAPLEDE